MPKTVMGAHCARCQFEVTDFTGMSPNEIRETLSARAGERVCGHIRKEQLVTLNEEFSTWHIETRTSNRVLLLSALILVFGLSLFSCTSTDDRRAVSTWRKNALEWTDKVGMCGDRPSIDNTLTGEVSVVSSDCEVINPPDLIDGEIGMDPSYLEYLQEHNDQ